VPPADDRYHFISVPDTTRLATVGLFIAQKDCEDGPSGAAGLFTTANTANRVADSQPSTV